MRRPPLNQRGIALVTTLVFMAIIVLGAGAFAFRVEQAVALASLEQARAEALRMRYSALNRMLYRLSVLRTGLNGLGLIEDYALKVDGTRYQDSGQTIIQLQDQRGLFNLRHLDREGLLRLLGQYNVPLNERARLVDSLMDYVDEDDFRRLQGAESADYLAASLPVPANRYLRTVQELAAVYGWEELTTTDLSSLLSVSPTVSGVNVNAAPAKVLASLPGIDIGEAASLVEYRRKMPLTQEIIGQLTGMSPLQMQFRVFVVPSTSFKLVLSCEVCGLQSDIYNIVLTPMSTVSPWVIESVISGRGVSGSVDKDATLPLPEIPTTEPMLQHAIHP